MSVQLTTGGGTRELLADSILVRHSITHFHSWKGKFALFRRLADGDHGGFMSKDNVQSHIPSWMFLRGRHTGVVSIDRRGSSATVLSHS